MFSDGYDIEPADLPFLVTSVRTDMARHPMLFFDAWGLIIWGRSWHPISAWFAATSCGCPSSLGELLSSLPTLVIAAQDRFGRRLLFDGRHIKHSAAACIISRANHVVPSVQNRSGCLWACGFLARRYRLATYIFLQRFEYRKSCHAMGCFI